MPVDNVESGTSADIVDESSNGISASLAALRRRVLIGVFLRVYWISQAILDIGVIAGIFLSSGGYRYMDRFWLLTALVVAPAAIALARCAAVRVPHADLARLIDERAHLAERISTAVEFAGARGNRMVGLLEADAFDAVRQVDMRVSLPLRRDGILAGVVLAATILLCIWHSEQEISAVLMRGNASAGGPTIGWQRVVPLNGSQIPKPSPAQTPSARHNPEPKPASPQHPAARPASAPGSSNTSNGQSPTSATGSPPTSSSGGNAAGGSSPAKSSNSSGANSSGHSPSQTAGSKGASKHPAFAPASAPGGAPNRAGQRSGSGPGSGSQSNRSGSSIEPGQSGQSGQSVKPGGQADSAQNGQNGQSGQSGSSGQSRHTAQSGGSPASGSSGARGAQPSSANGSGPPSSAGGRAAPGGSGTGGQSSSTLGGAPGSPDAGTDQGGHAPSIVPRTLPAVPNRSTYSFRLPKPSGLGRQNVSTYPGKAVKPEQGNRSASSVPIGQGSVSGAGSVTVNQVEQDPRIPVGYRSLVKQYFGAGAGQP